MTLILYIELYRNVFDSIVSMTDGYERMKTQLLSQIIRKTNLTNEIRMHSAQLSEFQKVTIYVIN